MEGIFYSTEMMILSESRKNNMNMAETEKLIIAVKLFDGLSVALRQSG